MGLKLLCLVNLKNPKASFKKLALPAVELQLKIVSAESCNLEINLSSHFFLNSKCNG